jgi:hypothetical protein
MWIALDVFVFGRFASRSYTIRCVRVMSRRNIASDGSARGTSSASSGHGIAGAISLTGPRNEFPVGSRAVPWAGG